MLTKLCLKFDDKSLIWNK